MFPSHAAFLPPIAREACIAMAKSQVIAMGMFCDLVKSESSAKLSDNICAFGVAHRHVETRERIGTAGVSPSIKRLICHAARKARARALGGAELIDNQRVRKLGVEFRFSSEQSCLRAMQEAHREPRFRYSAPFPGNA